MKRKQQVNQAGRRRRSSRPASGWWIVMGVMAALLSGCVLDRVDDVDGRIAGYQEALLAHGPQARVAREGVDTLRPVHSTKIPALPTEPDQDSGNTRIMLSIEDAVMRTLANSPEISVLSYDPSIAREGVTESVADFDPALFGTLSYEKTDSPVDSISLGGKTDVRLWESGIKQRGITGMEWSVSYGLTRHWDDLITRRLHYRYEPMLVFQIRQPLLRDAWWGVNLADVKRSRLNYKLALTGFRRETERIASEVITLYWTLYNARESLAVQKSLLDLGKQTLEKVLNRQDIDATMLQVKQTESAVQARKALFIQLEKQVVDIQDALVMLLSDHQLNLIDRIEIMPMSLPNLAPKKFDAMTLLKTALVRNPEMEEAKTRVKLAELDRDVAKWQRLPKLNLVASAKMEGMAESMSTAHNRLDDGHHTSYSLGIVFEYPFGNRKPRSKFRQMSLRLDQAMSAVNVVGDRLASRTKEAMRKASMAFEEIQVQKETVKAAEIHLQALEDTESIRERLTPEFLLVKLQAQESLAAARRAEAAAVSDYNIALVQIARATGTVLDMRSVKRALPAADEAAVKEEKPEEKGAKAGEPQAGEPEEKGKAKPSQDNEQKTAEEKATDKQG